MSLTKKINNMSDEIKIALLEQSIGHINQTLIRIEKRFDQIDERFNKQDERFIKIEEKIQDNFRWTIGVMITLFSGLYATALGGMVARLCHWI